MNAVIVAGGRIEPVVAEPAVSAVGALLVVREDLLHGLAARVVVRATGLTEVAVVLVSVDDETHLAVRAHEGLPRRLGGRPTRPLCERAAGRRKVQERVGEHDHLAIGMCGEHAIRPCEHRRRCLPLQSEDEPVDATRREERVVVHVAAVFGIRAELVLPHVAAVPRRRGRPRRVLEATRGEPRVVGRVCTGGVVEVVIAGHDGVRHAVVVEHFQPVRGVCPLARRVPLVHDVADLHDELRVESSPGCRRSTASAAR